MSDFPTRIVYADDDKLMRKLVRESVERARRGILFVTCSGGQDLVNRVRELKPELILLDLAMPEVTGPDVIQRLHDNGVLQNVPIIFLTGKTRVEMEDHYKAINVIGVIHKPFETKTLADVIEEMWKRHKAGN